MNEEGKLFDAARLDWYKFCAVVMHKHRLNSVEITPADIEAFARQNTAIAVDLRDGKCVIKLLDDAEIKAMVAEAKQRGSGIVHEQG